MTDSAERPTTYGQIDDWRAAQGKRALGRDFHYFLCNGLECCCYMEGVGIAASSHLDVLDWFCKTDADLVRERLALAEGVTDV